MMRRTDCGYSEGLINESFKSLRTLSLTYSLCTVTLVIVESMIHISVLILKRFANEDHLSVHKKKHEMSLSLSVDSNQKSVPFLDQTPTPTRFIRNCEEVGLFQDLQNVNPFDEQFRKAVQSNSSTTNNEINSLLIHPQADHDTLNTPSIFPTNLTHDEPCTPVSTQVKEEGSKISRSSNKDTNVPSISVSEVDTSKSFKTKNDDDNDDDDDDDDDVIPLPLPASTSHSVELIISKPAVSSNTVVDLSAAQLIESPKNIVIKNKPVIMGTVQIPLPKPSPVVVSPPSVITPLVQPIVLHIPENSNLTSHHIIDQESLIKNVHINDMNKIAPVKISPEARSEPQIIQEVDSAVKNILPRPITVNNPVTQTNASTVLHYPPIVENQVANKGMNFQVLLKLPDGSTVPVQLPSVNMTSVTSKVSTTMSSVTVTNDNNSAKQKLKQVLVQNKIAVKHIKSPDFNNEVINNKNIDADSVISNLQNSSNPSPIIWSRDVFFKFPTKLGDVHHLVCRSPKDNLKLTTFDAGHCGLNRWMRRKSEEEEVPDEKRQKFLERNRAAATRCRIKRKSWIDSLEGKAHQLQQTNSHLQTLSVVQKSDKSMSDGYMPWMI
ncbi:Cyclic AMP-dependent transcription factor ATF-2 [Nymphon striatum]|nr:Cyclic AMP-dependent transcription factor ATF-2 [Nymphon striatum]